MPVTIKVFGVRLAGVTTCTSSPGATPNDCARTRPRMTPSGPASAPPSSAAASWVTDGSRAGSMPRRIAPVVRAPAENSPCPWTNGAAAVTLGSCATWAISRSGSAIGPSAWMVRWALAPTILDCRS